jgi:hypothetical protein
MLKAMKLDSDMKIIKKHLALTLMNSDKKQFMQSHNDQQRLKQVQAKLQVNEAQHATKSKSVKKSGGVFGEI